MEKKSSIQAPPLRFVTSQVDIEHPRPSHKKTDKNNVHHQNTDLLQLLNFP